MNKDINEINIPFMIAPLVQFFADVENIDKCSEFYDDLKNNEYNIHIYCSGTEGNEIHITFDKKDEYYIITSCANLQPLRYCCCTPDMEDYRKDKECCGHDCDWFIPTFNICKINPIKNYEYAGDESSYWRFEDKFYEYETELKKEKDLKEFNELQKTIYECQKKINKLIKKM